MRFSHKFQAFVALCGVALAGLQLLSLSARSKEPFDVSRLVDMVMSGTYDPDLIREWHRSSPRNFRVGKLVDSMEMYLSEPWISENAERGVIRINERRFLGTRLREAVATLEPMEAEVLARAALLRLNSSRLETGIEEYRTVIGRLRAEGNTLQETEMLFTRLDQIQREFLSFSVVLDFVAETIDSVNPTLRDQAIDLGLKFLADAREVEIAQIWERLQPGGSVREAMSDLYLHNQHVMASAARVLGASGTQRTDVASALRRAAREHSRHNIFSNAVRNAAIAALQAMDGHCEVRLLSYSPAKSRNTTGWVD